MVIIVAAQQWENETKFISELFLLFEANGVPQFFVIYFLKMQILFSVH